MKVEEIMRKIIDYQAELAGDVRNNQLATLENQFG